MRIVVVGDLHGQIPRIHYSEPDVIIAPGDFCSDGVRDLMFKALEMNLQNKDTKIRWYQLIEHNNAKSHIEKSLEDGRKVLERLNSFHVPVFLVPGNWDWTPDSDAEWDYLKQNHFEYLLHGLDNLINIHHRRFSCLGLSFIGHGIHSGPEYPQYASELSRYTTEELSKIKTQYERELYNLVKLFKDAKEPIILLSHNVPFDTEVDIILNKKTSRYGLHFGSLITRNLIDEFQPLLCVGGHMHEPFASCKVGKTLVINAGFGKDVNVLIEIASEGIRRVEFNRGENIDVGF